MLDYIKQIDTSLTLLLNGSDCTFVDGIAITATSTIVWIPIAAVLLYLIIKKNKPFDSFLIVLGIGIAIFLADQMASGICKPYFCRFRPTHDPEIKHLIDIVNDYRGGKYGFFSSHAANTFAVATFLTYIFRNYKTTILLYSWALLNCWTRIYLGVHYLGDILTGIVWGLLVGVCTFHVIKFLRRLYFHKRGYPIPPLSNYNETDIKVFNTTILITYICIPIIGLFVVD